MTRNRIIIGGVMFAIALFALTFPLWSPYFIDDVVDEAFPEISSAAQSAFESMPEDEQDVFIAMREENPDLANEMLEAAVQPEATADDPMPDMPDEPIILSQGTFGRIDPVHGGEGTATIYELPDGSRVLRFEDFRVTNGPDLRVILATGDAPSTSGALGDYVELDNLSGNVGNQNYTIPADFDLSLYNSVVIYCLPFRVVFSYATLSESAS